MAYFVAYLEMLAPEKNLEFRQAHLDYLQAIEEQGKLFAKGAFADGSGGMVIYQADNWAEAQKLAEEDPYVVEGVRKLHLREWNKA